MPCSCRTGRSSRSERITNEAGPPPVALYLGTTISRCSLSLYDPAVGRPIVVWIIALASACNEGSASTPEGETDGGSGSTDTTSSSSSTVGTSVTTQSSSASDTSTSASTADTTLDPTSTSETASTSSTDETSGDESSSSTTETTGGILIPCSDRVWGAAVSLQAVDEGVANTDPYLVVDDAGNVTALWSQSYPGAPGTGPHFNRYEPSNGGWQGAAEIDPEMPWQWIRGAAVDDDGAVTMIVSVLGDVFEPVFAYRYDAALDTWTAGAPLAGATRSFRTGPAVDSSGNVFVVLEDTQGALRVVRYDNATETWAPETTASAPGHTVHIDGHPNLAVDAAGNAFVVYGALAGVQHTWAVRYDAGSEAWSDAFDLGTSAQLPLVAAQSDGTALAMWREIFAGDQLYHYRARFYDPNDDSWAAAEWVEQLETGSTTEGRVLADDTGGFVVSLQRGGDFHSDRYEPGVGFTTATQHDADGTGTASEYVIPAVDGGAWAFWTQSDNVDVAVLARRFDAGRGWEDAVAVDDNANGGAGLRNVVVDAEGTPTVIWLHDEDGDAHLRASCYDAELGAWAPAQDVETSLEFSLNSASVVDGEGAVTVIWHQYAANERRIWVNRFE